MLAVAEGSGLTLRVALSDMGQVLGREAGNALEVRAVLDLLRGHGGCPRLHDLTLALAGELLCLGGLAADAADADRRLRHALASGAAADRFARMVAALGGPTDLLERPQAYLPQASVQRAVLASGDGYVAALDVRALGQVVVDLGGGRTHPGQALDHAVGLGAVVGRGCRIEPGQPLAIVHARCEANAEVAVDAVRRAYRIEPGPPPPVPLLQWHAPIMETVA